MRSNINSSAQQLYDKSAVVGCQKFAVYVTLSLYNFFWSAINIKIRIFGMITNQTTIHRRSNDKANSAFKNEENPCQLSIVPT